MSTLGLLHSFWEITKFSPLFNGHKLAVNPSSLLLFMAISWIPQPMHCSIFIFQAFCRTELTPWTCRCINRKSPLRTKMSAIENHHMQRICTIRHGEMKRSTAHGTIVTNLGLCTSCSKAVLQASRSIHQIKPTNAHGQQWLAATTTA